MRIQLMRRSDQINKIHHTYKHIKTIRISPSQKKFTNPNLNIYLNRKHDVKFSKRLKIEIIPNRDGLRKKSKNKEKKYDN